MSNVIKWINKNGGEAIWKHHPEKDSVFCRKCFAMLPTKHMVYRKHAQSKKHTQNVVEELSNHSANTPDTKKFTMDLAKLLSICNVSPHKVEHPFFIEFFKTYTHRTVPSRRSMKRKMDTLGSEKVNAMNSNNLFSNSKDELDFFSSRASDNKKELTLVMEDPGKRLEEELEIDDSMEVYEHLENARCTINGDSKDIIDKSEGDEMETKFQINVWNSSNLNNDNVKIELWNDSFNHGTEEDEWKRTPLRHLEQGPWKAIDLETVKSVNVTMDHDYV